MFIKAITEAGYDKSFANFRHYGKKRSSLDDDQLRDIFHDAMLKCEERALTGELPSDTDALAYFYRALRNTMYDALNRGNKHADITEDIPDDEDEQMPKQLVGEAFEVETELTPEEFWEQLTAMAVVWKIDPHAFNILKYMVQTSCTYEHAAQLMGWSEVKTWQKVKKVKDKIKTIWKKQYAY